MNCNVKVDATQVEGSEKRIFDVMEKAIFEFMNSRKWTDDVFSMDERIECSIVLNVTERVSPTHFKGTMMVQSRRPVYSTSYNSTLLNRLDKQMEWDYVQFDPMNFSMTTHLSNLTSVLAFYAYYIIGMDYDSFSLYGGNKYFIKAQQIANNAQSAPEKGWKSFGDLDNRYWMIENTLNNVYKPIRKVVYEYHRLGLDLMQKDKNEAKKAIATSLQQLGRVYDQKPGSFQMRMFFNAKVNEIVNMFKTAPPAEKNKVVTLCNRIDPGNTQKYNKILQN